MSLHDWASDVLGRHREVPGPELTYDQPGDWGMRGKVVEVRHYLKEDGTKWTRVVLEIGTGQRVRADLPRRSSSTLPAAVPEPKGGQRRARPSARPRRTSQRPAQVLEHPPPDPLLPWPSNKPCQGRDRADPSCLRSSWKELIVAEREDRVSLLTFPLVCDQPVGGRGSRRPPGSSADGDPRPPRRRCQPLGVTPARGSWLGERATWLALGRPHRCAFCAWHVAG
jgi:hypothetical protein